MNNKISIIICTQNRPQHLKNCLKSILNNHFSNYEIIIIDSSINNETENIISNNPSNRIVYIHNILHGKSRALNYCLNLASGNICAITDDDCIVEKNWLKNINKTISNNPDVNIIIGRVLPYLKTKKSGKYNSIPDYTKAKISPNKIRFLKSLTFNTLVSTCNNLVITQRLINKIGTFKPWLGINSTGLGAEDLEYIIRAITNNEKVLFEPSIRVFHNCWLNSKQIERKNLYYYCGYVSVFIYYFIRGNRKISVLLVKLLLIKINSWKKTLIPLVTKFHPKMLIKNILDILYEVIFIIRATFIGLFYAIYD